MAKPSWAQPATATVSVAVSRSRAARVTKPAQPKQAAVSRVSDVNRLRAPARDPASPPDTDAPAVWEQAYLDALAANGGQRIAAAKSAKIAYVTVYRRRQDSPRFETAERGVMKMAFDTAESEAARRAVDGVESLYTTKDGTVHKERKYSDTLLLRWLERQETGSWRQKQQIEHSGGLVFKTRAERKAALEQARAALKQAPVTAVNGRS